MFVLFLGSIQSFIVSINIDDVKVQRMGETYKDEKKKIHFENYFPFSFFILSLRTELLQNVMFLFIGFFIGVLGCFHIFFMII